MPSCQIFFACSQFSANDGTAAGTQHDTYTQHDVDEGIHDIDSGKGCRSHKTGNENTVCDDIGCHKHHHNDGGKCKTEQSTKGKFFGNVVLHNMTSL